MTVIAFDVNETLLDLRPLDSVLGGADIRARWFSLMLQNSCHGAPRRRQLPMVCSQKVSIEPVNAGCQRPQGRQGHSRRRAGGELKRLPRKKVGGTANTVPVESM